MLPAPTSDTSVMYLVRHAATANNLARPPVLQGQHVDEPLSDSGRAQARRTGELLAGVTLNAVFSSPLRRARETAEAIARHHGLTPHDIPELKEVHVGAWEGLAWEHIERQYPEDYRRFREQPEQHGYVGGETLVDVRERVVPALAGLLERHLGHNIAVVGHSVVNRVFLANVLGLPLAAGRRVSQDNCGLSVVRQRGGKLKIVTLNTLFHLSDLSR